MTSKELERSIDFVREIQEKTTAKIAITTETVNKLAEDRLPFGWS